MCFFKLERIEPSYSSKSKEPIFPDFNVNQVYFYKDGTLVNSSFGYYPHEAVRFINWEEWNNKEHKNSLPDLYSKRSSCCGCSACSFVCPVQAINMEPDEEGFLYPVINAALCVGCNQCVNSCTFQRAQEG